MSALPAIFIIDLTGMYETAPAEPKARPVPMTPAIPVRALEPSRAGRALRIAIGIAIGIVLIATVFLGSPAPAPELPQPVQSAIAAPPPPEPPPAPPPVVQVELTRDEVKEQLRGLTKLMFELDRSSVPKEQVGPIWREVIPVRKQFESGDPDLVTLSRRMREIESKVRALLPR